MFASLFSLPPDPMCTATSGRSTSEGASLKLMFLGRVDPSLLPPLDDRGDPPVLNPPAPSAPNAPFELRIDPLGVRSREFFPGSSLWLAHSSFALFTGRLPLLIPAGFRSAFLPRNE